MSTAEIFVIETLSEKAVAVGAMLDTIMRKIKRPLGCDLERTCASKGTFSGRLHETVTDVFSNWPLDTLECEGSDKLQLKLFVGIALVPAEATCTKGGCDCTCESDRETSALSAHVVTILDKVDHKVRTKASVTIELSSVASWQRAWHWLCAKDQVCCDTALGVSLVAFSQKGGSVCLHKLGAMCDRTASTVFLCCCVLFRHVFVDGFGHCCASMRLQH